MRLTSQLQVYDGPSNSILENTFEKQMFLYTALSLNFIFYYWLNQCFDLT